MRAREIAVQTALGATRWSLIRECLIESALLAFAGGVTGVLASQWISQALATTVMNLPAERLPPTFAVDGRVLAFALLTTAATTLLCGAFPAWRSTRISVGLMAVDHRGGRPVSTLRSMRTLVIAQVAMSFVLVMAAALFGRTLASFARIDIGFDPRHVVEVTLDPVPSGYTREQMPALRVFVLRAGCQLFQQLSTPTEWQYRRASSAAAQQLGGPWILQRDEHPPKPRARVHRPRHGERPACGDHQRIGGERVLSD
jgi:hypothetical protein